MKYAVFIPTVIIFLLLVGLLYYFYFSPKPSHETKTVTINKQVITLEVADTTAKRARGLMYRTELPYSSGMLFVFEKEGLYPFWMANTYIPLDIIWLNSDKEIVYINHNTPPCTATGNIKAVCTSYNPKKYAKYVIELNGGWAKKNRLNIKDKISF
ncbi:MAG: DUF192 domain-containing protein [Patescibacteria group bacterium]